MVIRLNYKYDNKIINNYIESMKNEIENCKDDFFSFEFLNFLYFIISIIFSISLFLCILITLINIKFKFLTNYFYFIIIMFVKINLIFFVTTAILFYCDRYAYENYSYFLFLNFIIVEYFVLFFYEKFMKKW